MSTMYDSPVPMSQATANYSMGGMDYTSKSQATGNTAGGIGAGIATAMGQPWLAPLILLGGNILGSLFSRRQEPQLTPEQAWFRDTVKFYTNLGKRSADMRRIAGAMRLPAEKVATIGYPSTYAAIQANGIKGDTSTGATATLYDESRED